MDDGNDVFRPGGGTALVAEWLTELAKEAPAVEVIWGSLDGPLRLVFAQEWLITTGAARNLGTKHRDEAAAELAAAHPTRPEFTTFYDSLTRHFHQVYADINGRPCLVGHTEPIGVDMELVAFTSEEYVGHRRGPIPMHCFITRLQSPTVWVIAANARRLPIPGWPPTQQIIRDLEIDG